MNIKKCLTSVLVACILATSQLASAAAPAPAPTQVNMEAYMQIGQQVPYITSAQNTVAAATPAPAPAGDSAKPAAPIPATQHPALFLVGDSIMNTGTGNGATGPWGYGAELIPMFDSQKIHVYNEGKGGRSSRGYIDEGAWKGVLARMEKGDWVLVQFGHNDTKNSANYPDRAVAPGNGDGMADVDGPNGTKVSVHSYGWYLRQYAKDTKDKGATLVILSPVPRNEWANGKIKRGFDGYVGWAAEAAKQSGTLYVDLNSIAADRYDALGQQPTAAVFNDTQHTKKAGAKINAESVVAGLKTLKDCPLVGNLLPVPAATATAPAAAAAK